MISYALVLSRPDVGSSVISRCNRGSGQIRSGTQENDFWKSNQLASSRHSSLFSPADASLQRSSDAGSFHRVQPKISDHVLRSLSSFIAP
jgi:hypothetical protein